MKLLRLKLNTPFRSLAAGFEAHFLREWDFQRCSVPCGKHLVHTSAKK